MNLKQNYESGRSMTEMLGVLAVIGVLSIGGIAGYNYAMNKHRANQVLQDIRLIYQEIKYPNTVQKIVQNGTFPDMELDMLSPYKYGFDFPNPEDFNYDSKTEKTPNLISVNIEGVSKGACDVLLKNKPTYVLMLKANGESTWNCTQDENELSYIFEITSDNLEYGTCSVCTGEHCFDDDLNCPEGENCQNNVCSKCDPGYTDHTSGNCTKCSTNWRENKYVTKEDCLRCDNVTWISRSPGQGCWSCDAIHIWGIKKAECDICSRVNPNVVFMGITEESGGCSNCSQLGTTPDTLEEACRKCPETVWYPKKESDKGGLCTMCRGNSEPTDNYKMCQCTDPDHYWAFNDYNLGADLCDPCSSETTRYAPKSECDKCAQRYFTGTNERFGECALCSEGQTKSADGRSCVDA